MTDQAEVTRRAVEVVVAVAVVLVVVELVAAVRLGVSDRMLYICMCVNFAMHHL